MHMGHHCSVSSFKNFNKNLFQVRYVHVYNAFCSSLILKNVNVIKFMESFMEYQVCKFTYSVLTSLTWTTSE